MDPLTLSIAAIGVGMSLFGGVSGAGNAKDAAGLQAQEATAAQGIQSNISGLEGSVNSQRQQQMALSSQRQQLENFRNTQRIRAQGLNAAVGQGAQFGTGLQGAQAQATDQGLFNSQGINQNLEIGNNLFSLDNQISQQKLALSGLQSSTNVQLSGIQSNMATDQGIANVGSALTKSAGTASNIFGAVKSGMGGFGSGGGTGFSLTGTGGLY